MTDQDGAFWATFCTMQTLLATLVGKGVLEPKDVVDLIGDAEEFLAGLSPALMTPSARERAKFLLQQFGKIG